VQPVQEASAEAGLAAGERAAQVQEAAGLAALAKEMVQVGARLAAGAAWVAVELATEPETVGSYQLSRG
jgi:hypothetical protein